MSDEERERLVLDNTKLVWHVVHKLYGRFLPEQQEELYHYGLEGLVKAARDYDPSRGVKFGSMAFSYIRNAIGHGIRVGFGPVYVPVYKRGAYAAMLYGGGEMPEGLEPDEAAALQALSKGVLSLNTPAVRDHLGAEDPELERAEQRADVEHMLDRLESREWYVIVRRYLRGEGLLEIAQDLGISKERVRGIEETALKKLREG